MTPRSPVLKKKKKKKCVKCLLYLFIKHLYITQKLCIFVCVHVLRSFELWKPPFFFSQYCLRLVFSEVVHVFAEVLQLWWLMKPCTYTLIFCAVPFDLSLRSQNLKKDFFFSVFLLSFLYGGLPQLKLQVYGISSCWVFYPFCWQPPFFI